jgi:hypothetical protein
MERMKPIGKVQPKKATEIKTSKVGIGFEKLDRNVFDPEKAYGALGELGVKWVRIQSGWERTEKVKGCYDFEWLDGIVDNLLLRGMIPWVCLCYGNGLYGGQAKEVFGAVGCPPIFTEEQRSAWTAYVQALVAHYRDKVSYFEVWNEPDGIWCWKHGPNATELGNFTVETARAVKAANPEAKVIGGSLCLRPIAYINEALATGMGEWIDYLTFHEYTHDESRVFERVEALKALCKKYNPKIEIIQGESGSQSRSGGAGALRSGFWTPLKQAKQLARHTVADLMTDVHFLSYFTTVDMIEALNGKVGELSSYLDYGFFGVLGADFDENGRSVGTYTPKPSYYVLQNIASIFREEWERVTLPVIFLPKEAPGIFGKDLERSEVTLGGFRRDSGELMAYWTPTDIMTTSFEGSVSFQIHSEYESVRLIDVMDGKIYQIPTGELVKEDYGGYRIEGGTVHRDAHGMFYFQNLPVKDTPLLLEFGNFVLE